MVARLHRIAIVLGLLSSVARAADGDQKLGVTDNTQGSLAANVIDGDLSTQWCITAATSTLTITLPPLDGDVNVLVAHDGMGLKVSPDIGGSKTSFNTSPVRLKFAKSTKSITLQPIPYPHDQVACISEVTIIAADGTQLTPEIKQPKPAKQAKATPKPAKPTRRAPHDTVTADALAHAPDSIRALRSGLADCDADTISSWITFPLRIGASTFANAAALAKTCSDDPSLLAPSVTDLDAALGQIACDADGILTLPLHNSTWRLVWRKRQWWLTSID
jgi:hypothetical protein